PDPWPQATGGSGRHAWSPQYLGQVATSIHAPAASLWLIPRGDGEDDDCGTSGCQSEQSLSAAFLACENGVSLRSQHAQIRYVRWAFALRYSWVGGENLTLPPEAGAEAEAAIPEAILAGAGPTEGRCLGTNGWVAREREKG